MFTHQRAFNFKELHYPLDTMNDIKIKDKVVESRIPNLAPEPLTEVTRRHAGFLIEDYRANGAAKLVVTSWEAKAIHLLNKIDSTKHILRNKLASAGLRIISSTMDEVIIGRI